MEVWLNKDPEVDAPTLRATGLLIQPGYVGYFNDKITDFLDNRAFGGGGTQVAITDWNSHFDSAFEVKIWDKLSSQLEFLSGSIKNVFVSNSFIPEEISPSFKSSLNSVEWILKTTTQPMLFGDSIVQLMG